MTNIVFWSLKAVKQPQYFALYQRTGHLKGQNAFEDFRRIFETLWQDRAANAGWTLEIEYEDPQCLTRVLSFTRPKA